MSVYAVVDESGTVINVAEAEADVAEERGWLGPISSEPGGPGIGWSTPDGGATWTPPAPAAE